MEADLARMMDVEEAVEDCSICFEGITEAALLPCNHRFHHECIMKWFGKKKPHKTCPLCRGEVKVAVLCTVCQEYIYTNDTSTVAQIDCGHIFHHGCVLKPCPNCRSKFTIPAILSFIASCILLAYLALKR